MTNPTSNFGWQMPTSTDLVTDLPADFEVFGQAVDNTLVDLKGGTTGQILSKTSATDMDFTWTTPNPGDITGVTAGTGISGGGTSGDVTVTNSMATAMTTSGDLIQATGSGTFARLGTGTNGQYLTTNGTTNSWGSISAGGMTLLSTTTLSGSSTSISSIDQTYNTLQVWIYGVYRTASTDSVELFIAPNGDTSECSNGAGTYQDEGTPYTTAFGGYNQKLAVNCAAVMRLEQTSGGGNGANGWVLTISNYTSSTQIKAANCFGRFKRSGGSKGSVNWGGGIFLTDAITSLVFSLSSGDFGGGTVRIYGVK